jgi:hypothetical protein
MELQRFIKERRVIFVGFFEITIIGKCSMQGYPVVSSKITPQKLFYLVGLLFVRVSIHRNITTQKCMRSFCWRSFCLAPFTWIVSSTCEL